MAGYLLLGLWSCEIMPGARRKSHVTEQAAKWQARQKKVFTNWTNNKLVDRQHIAPVTDLYTDLSDGFVLYNLLEGA